MSKIEEVARAIHAASEEVYTIEASRLLARAAIEAMRDLTEAMHEAGIEAVDSSKADLRDVWSAMIDAALSEQPQ